MSKDQLLYVTLLALLPKDGRLVQTGVLARTVGATEKDVSHALAPALRAGQVRIDHELDAYASVRYGGSL